MRSAIVKPAAEDGSDGPLPVADPPDPARLDTELNARAAAAVAVVVGIAAGSSDTAAVGVTVGSAGTAATGRLDTELKAGDAEGTDVAGAAGAAGAAGGGWLEMELKPCARTSPAATAPITASRVTTRVRLFMGCGL